MVIDPIACEVVKEIFNLYLKGYGFTRIAHYLNDKNIPCPSLYKYRKGIKLNVISNKSRDKWIRRENMHEAIIDEETFTKVQIAIKERTKPMKVNGVVHNFSGKVFCKECGNYMRKKNSSKYEYLICSSNCDGHNNCVNKISIRYDILEELVLSNINKKIKEFYDLNILENELLKKRNNKFIKKNDLFMK